MYVEIVILNECGQLVVMEYIYIVKYYVGIWMVYDNNSMT